MSNNFIPNSFQVPNALVDILMPALSDNALRCYLAITRKTKGWQKETDRIAISQLMAMTNKSKNSVIKGVKELINHNLVTKVMVKSRNGNIAEYRLTNDIDLFKSCTSSKSEPVRQMNMTCSQDEHQEVHNMNTQNNTNKNNYSKNNNPLPPKGESACAEELAQNQKANNTVTGEKNKSESEKANELEKQEEKVKEEKKESSAPRIDYAGIANAYNQAIDTTGANLPYVMNTKQLSDKRKRAIKKMVSVFNKRFGNSSVAAFNDYFADFIEVAPAFYFGENNTSWVASFDYLMRETTLEKVIERQFGGVA